MGRYASNEDVMKAIPQFAAGWWSSKTAEEKAWYLKLWTSCTGTR
jgi:hypothetical protein